VDTFGFADGVVKLSSVKAGHLRYCDPSQLLIKLSFGQLDNVAELLDVFLLMAGRICKDITLDAKLIIAFVQNISFPGAISDSKEVGLDCSLSSTTWITQSG